jgi:hypothetical protein
MAQAVEHLSSKCEALSSNPSIIKRRKKEKEQEREREREGRKKQFWLSITHSL